jgi:hypothetical protein
MLNLLVKCVVFNSHNPATTTWTTPRNLHEKTTTSMNCLSWSKHCREQNWGTRGGGEKVCGGHARLTLIPYCCSRWPVVDQHATICLDWTKNQTLTHPCPHSGKNCASVGYLLVWQQSMCETPSSSADTSLMHATAASPSWPHPWGPPTDESSREPAKARIGGEVESMRAAWESPCGRRQRASPTFPLSPFTNRRRHHRSLWYVPRWRGREPEGACGGEGWRIVAGEPPWLPSETLAAVPDAAATCEAQGWVGGIESGLVLDGWVLPGGSN